MKDPRKKLEMLMVTAMAQAMSKVELVEQLQETIDQYKEEITLNRSPEEINKAYDKITAVCQLFLAKEIVNHMGVEEMMKRHDQHEAADRLFDVGSN